MAERYPDEDDFGILDDCDTPKEVDQALDLWDKYYGIPPYSYEVYVLMDGTKPEKFVFGPLELNYEPFYVGHGQIGRNRKSAALGRQKDKYTHKVARMIDIVEKKGGVIRSRIINRFYTKNKAFMVEKKLMNLIPRSFLTNSLIHYCEVPLLVEDIGCYKPYDVLIT